VQFIEVEDGVKLEVVDWGGSGRPMVLLAGLGANAHTYDKFAAKLTPSYHVYGITRRGFGASGAPPSGYSADRLGDDVLAVLAALNVNRPVLVGHSIAGQELSSVGSRYPDKVAGLIYLDAGYSYAYYDNSLGDLHIELVESRRKLEELQSKVMQDTRPLIQELLETDLPRLEKGPAGEKERPGGDSLSAFGACANSCSSPGDFGNLYGEKKVHTHSRSNSRHLRTSAQF
jgi:pimeloyl-ACP methyl ester carboxylesterase